MTRKQRSTSAVEWKTVIEGQKNFPKPLMQEVVQPVLEAERHERTESRAGYRSGYYRRGLVTRVGRLELRVPQDRQGRFATELFSRSNAASRPWWRLWRRCTCRGSRRGRSRR